MRKFGIIFALCAAFVSAAAVGVPPYFTLGSTLVSLGNTITSISGLTLASPTISGTASGNGTLPNAMLVTPPTATGTATTGQIPGTATNDNAAAGKVGEYVIASGVETGLAQSSATVTITNASPAVITWGTTTPFATGSTITGTCAVVNFTTSGGLPTGLSVGTNYYVGGASISGNTFSVATSCDNAIAGTYVNTSSAGSGTQTGVPTGILSTGTTIAIGGMSLTAGDWEVTVQAGFLTAASTSITILNTGSALSIASPLTQVGRITQLNLAANVPGVSNNVMTSGPARYSLSGTTTIYCLASGNFTVSTLAAWGGCRARRVR